MTLSWRGTRGFFQAECGSEGQGRVLVYQRDDAWSWSVDMLPGDAEPLIVGHGCPSAEEAKDRAAAQVAAWPSLIDGARRV